MSKKSAVIFTGVFLIVVGLIGFLTFFRHMNFYINDVTVNNEWTAEMGNRFETDLASNFFGKFSFVNLNGAIRKLLGQREMNGVVRLNNGYLTVPLRECPEEQLHQFADRTAALNSYLQNRGTGLVYVSPPYTGSKYDPELPAGIEDHSNDNIDRLLSLLEEAGVDTIDVRESMRADGIDHYEMTYKTDHHWTTEAGFYTYRLLEKYISEKTGCAIDPRISDISNYTVTKYEKWFLGSRGKRTGQYFAGTDDFTLIEPKFDITIRSVEGSSGTIRDFFIDKELLGRRDYESGYVYDAVLGWGAYSGDYVNPDSVNDIRILIISDSFAKAVNPYLIMGFGETKCILDAYTGNVTPDLIEDYDPDVVIMLYYSEYINADSGSFDFRGF